jgi:hypothetical protein
VGLSESTRLWLQADRVHEEGVVSQTEIGPSVEFSMKPLFRWSALAEPGSGPAKAGTVTFTMGYRYLISAGDVTENRIVLEASPKFPSIAKIVVSDRNRGELRFIAGAFSWCYRNRLTLGRAISVHSYSFSPYLRGEGFYDSKYEKWSTIALSAGAIFAIGKRGELEPYFQHQNQTGCTPNQQIETLGLKLSLYFHRESK